MRSRWVLGAALLLIKGVLWAEPVPIDLLQPIEGSKGLLLASEPGVALVQLGDGEVQEIPVKRGEQLTDLAETDDGWVAAGVRRKRSQNVLTIYRQSPSGLERMSPPPSQKAPLRLRPVLLMDGGEFDGLAWLEGDDVRSLAVRTADWSGARWNPSRRVSRPQPGSQTGLTGTVLADGTWLLVWAAFDGQDDEIVWSWRRGSSWSRPKRLAPGNSVPDITPTIVSDRGGALVAWSHFDGNDYRLMISRFRSGRWSKPRMVGAPGALIPRFARIGKELLLSYQNAWPSGWFIAQLDARDRIARRVELAAAVDGDRPVLLESDHRQVSLIWPENGEHRTLAWDILP